MNRILIGADFYAGNRLERFVLENEEELGMSLGLGINTADKGVVVELQLTVAGDVSREENSICVYEDPDQPIGKIVDISYNYE